MSTTPGTTTPRRSRRWQPLATPLAQCTDSRIEANWQGDALYTRPCNPEVDLMYEELQKREEEGNEEAHTDEETVFFSEFTLKKPKAKQPRGKKTTGDEIRTYRLGDTITVETDTLSRQRRPPSVAVIVSMWEVRKKGESRPTQGQLSRMRLRVHWFLRPTELAAIREKRDHEVNEIYYTLASSDILTPDVIVDQCSVSSSRSHIGKEKEKWTYEVVKPKAKHSPKKKGSSSTAPDDDDGSDDDDVDELPSAREKDLEKFYCCYAINSQRGLFFGFSWEKKHQEGLKASLQVPEEAEGDGKWGLGSEWNVDTDLEKSRSKKKVRTGGGKQSSRKGGPPPKKRKKLQGDAEDDSEQESSDDGGEDSEWDADKNDEEDEDHELDDDAESERDETDPEEADEDPFNPRTPSRKRKRGQGLKTPRKSGRGSIAQPTPHSKAALRQRKKLKAAVHGSPRKRSAATFRIQPPTLSLKSDLSHLPQDPWLRAMHVLHVGNRPEALPCRGDEYDSVFASVVELLEEGSGGCVYISGQPGTGKTATVHSVVRDLKLLAERNEVNPFTYVEINGLRIPEPSVAYTVLCEAIMRDNDDSKTSSFRMSSKESLRALTNHFSGRVRRPGDHAYVVLMDELDQLVTTKQDVIYNFFNWPTLAGSKLVVIAVANTHDLPERVMTGRVRSRLGMTRINFEPYKKDQLQTIVESRLEKAKEGLDEEVAKTEVLSKEAIKLAAMRINNITGDARRMLDLCRRVVELVSASKTLGKPHHVDKITSVMQNNPTAGYLRECSLHERIVLASLIKCIRQQGIDTIKWDDVQYQHYNYIGALTGPNDSTRKPTVAELVTVLDSLVASRAVLLEDGPAVARKALKERRVLLNIEQIEVERVLADVGGQIWKNALNA